jgi:hypothetical protein
VGAIATTLIVSCAYKLDMFHDSPFVSVASVASDSVSNVPLKFAQSNSLKLFPAVEAELPGGGPQLLT